MAFNYRSGADAGWHVLFDTPGFLAPRHSGRAFAVRTSWHDDEGAELSVSLMKRLWYPAVLLVFLMTGGAFWLVSGTRDAKVIASFQGFTNGVPHVETFKAIMAKKTGGQVTVLDVIRDRGALRMEVVPVNWPQ